jgi:hypothetical protein
MIYGLFMLIAGLAALFFLFNTGQMTAEKTKLVNTADAVAYSAAVMHARALNFDAYTNRALIANEVMVAQTVSVASWLEYAKEHTERVPPLNCLTYYSAPVAARLLKYEPLCIVMAYYATGQVLGVTETGFNALSNVVMPLTNIAKAALQTSQATMFASFLPARREVMQQVADANYAGRGVVTVDVAPLQDNYSLFDGGPFIKRNSGNERARFKEVEVAAANKDPFVSSRGWSDSSLGGCLFILGGKASHTASTTLTNYDEWSARDDGAFKTEILRLTWRGPRCRTILSYNLGDGRKSARANGGNWYYSGVPSFYDLSTAALGYVSTNADVKKRDPRLQFAVRLTRDKAQLRTSAGTSEVKPTGRMNIFQGAEARDVMAAVASSEVFFERTTPRVDGRKEQASLFNPYWQAHLIGNSAAVKAAAITRQQ